MGTSTLSAIAELKMHVRNEHQQNSTKTRMKRMFTTRSKATSSELPTPSTFLQPLDPQLVSQASNEAADEDPNHTHYLAPGLRDIISDCRHSLAIEEDELVSNPSQGGKLTLSQLFNFGNDHWAASYEGHARKSFDEELELYDLLNEDAATGDGTEVDVDETTAEILIG